MPTAACNLSNTQTQITMRPIRHKWGIGSVCPRIAPLIRVMVRRSSLQDIREQTYKVRDAWWTVLLVDPLAVRLVRLVAPYRWITPNLLTVLAMLLGVGSAACFLAQDHMWLI